MDTLHPSFIYFPLPAPSLFLSLHTPQFFYFARRHHLFSSLQSFAVLFLDQSNIQLIYFMSPQDVWAVPPV